MSIIALRGCSCSRGPPSFSCRPQAVYTRQSVYDRILRNVSSASEGGLPARRAGCNAGKKVFQKHIMQCKSGDSPHETQLRTKAMEIGTTMAMTMLPDLGEEPTHFADCCVAVSRPLVEAIIDRLPRSPALVLSVGSGSGFLESLLLEYSKLPDSTPSLGLYGVEVPTCTNKYLPEDRVLRVASTSGLYTDAVFASALMFVYPRQVSLITRYLQVCSIAALETVVWLGHRSDWADTKAFISAFFGSIEYLDGPGIAEYELLVIATNSKTAHKTFASND